MKLYDWKTLAELIGISAVVGSLIFVGIQLKQEQAIAKNEIAAAMLSASVEVRNALNDHADIWIKANAGQSLTETEEFIFKNLVGNLRSQAMWESVQWSNLGSDGNYPIHLFAAYLRENPGARKAWLAQEESRQQFRPLLQEPLESSGFAEKVREALEKQDQL